MVIPIWIFNTRRFEIDFDKLILSIKSLTFVVLCISVKHILSGEFDAYSDGRFGGEGMLDTIYLGHQGLTLFLLSLYKFKQHKLVNALCAFTGILTIFLAGSRGPMVSLCVCLIIYLFLNSYNIKTKIISILGIITVLIFYVLILNVINDIFLSHGINSFNRITMYLLGEMEGGDGRWAIYEKAFTLINQSPIFGYHYLLDDGSYVHNIFIEQFMALGYIGGIIFMIAVISVVLTGYKKVSRTDIPGFKIFYLIFIQYLMFGMFSRTAIALPQLWICMSVVIHYSYKKYIPK